MSKTEQNIRAGIPDILTPVQYYEGAHRDDPETQAIKRLMFAVLKVLATLAPREEMILRMRFGIGQRASSFEDLSRQFSLTRERIRRIELEALRKMRERTRSLYSRASFATFSTSEP